MYICWLDSCCVPRKYKNPMTGTKFWRAFYQNEGSKWPLNQPTRLKNFVLVIRFLYWVVWQLSNQQIYFSVNGLFVPSWLGLICLYRKNVLVIEIVTTKGFKLVILIKKTVTVREKTVPDTSQLGEKNSTQLKAVGEKIAPGSKADCTRRCHVLTLYPGCRVQFHYCTILIQPGGYKGAIDRKNNFVHYFKHWISLCIYRFNQNKPSGV